MWKKRFKVRKQTGGHRHNTHSLCMYADVAVNSVIPELLKLRQRFHRKEADIFWSGLLIAVLVVPQCDSWLCDHVMEPNRAGWGGYDIFPLSPPVTAVCVCESGCIGWGWQQMTVYRCRGKIPRSVTMQTTRRTYVDPQEENDLRNPLQRSQTGSWLLASSSSRMS